MKRFHYIGVDQQGQTVQGTIDADDWSAALVLLTARGWTDCRPINPATAGNLTSADAVELAGYLSELADSGVPLASALKALAQDTASSSLRAAIDDFGARLESGQPLDAALESMGARLPLHVRKLLVSAARSGRLSQALSRLIERQRLADDMARRARQAVAYPAVLLGMLVIWLLFVTFQVLPQFNTLLVNDFGIETSWITKVGMNLPWIMLAVIGTLSLIVLIIRAVGGASTFSRFLRIVPITGPCRAARGLADFSGMLSEFLEEQIPLDESLALTAAGTRDPALQTACRQAAQHVSQGGSLSAALDRSRLFPKTLVRWAQWGEASAALPSALRAAATMFADRFELRLQLVRAFVPAIVFCLIAASAVFVAGGFFAGLFRLITDLSGSGGSEDLGSNPEFWAVMGALAVLVIATTLLVIAGVTRARGFAADVTRILLRYFAWSMIAAALLALSLLFMGPWGIIGWVVLFLAALRGAWRFRQTQKQALWSGLSLAADNRVPLAPMALAFADEQGGAFAIMARHLAQQLQCGADLAQAIAMSRFVLPAEAPLASRIGAESGDLCGAMRAARGRRSGALLMPPALMWLMFFVPIAFFAVVFVKVRIEPSFVAIINDFDTSPPAVTTAVSVMLGSPLVIYGSMLLMALIFVAWLQWRGTLTPRLPGLKRVVRWIELAPVLRILALVTRRQRPIAEALASIASTHPNRWIRRRMSAAVRDLSQGATWQESLRRRRLLFDADLAVLSAAERNGNLPWALEQLGDSFARRADFRLKAWGEIALPLLLAAFGLLVALFVVAYFVPMVYLINNMA